VTDQVLKKIEHLRFDTEQLAPAPQFLAINVK
jgi:hypothetical protein